MRHRVPLCQMFADVVFVTSAERFIDSFPNFPKQLEQLS